MKLQSERKVDTVSFAKFHHQLVLLIIGPELRPLSAVTFASTHPALPHCKSRWLAGHLQGSGRTKESCVLHRYAIRAVTQRQGCRKVGVFQNEALRNTCCGLALLVPIVSNSLSNKSAVGLIGSNTQPWFRTNPEKLSWYHHLQPTNQPINQPTAD